MADQIPRIKSKRQVLQLKPPHLCLQSLMVGLFMFAISIYCVQTVTCPSSVPSSTTTITEEGSFSGFTNTNTFGMAVGPVSNSLYYLYRLGTSPSYNTAVRKEDASGSQTWMASFAFYPIMKSLSVDAAEQSVYLASNTSPIVVIKLAASDGTIATQHALTGINASSNDVKTWLLADLSGYFVFGRDSSMFAKICKYTFSSSTAQCQKITNIKNGYGSLMISNSQFFVLGADSASPFNLQLYKITFSSVSVDWANQIACISGTCASAASGSMLSTDGSTIYLFFIYSPSLTTYLYFCGLSVSDGSVTTTRYKSSASVTYAYGSALNGDYAVATTLNSLIIYSISSSTFTIKSCSGPSLCGCGVEPSSGRFVVGGTKSNNGYTAKFVPQIIGLYPDFSSAAWSMTALSAGTDDIVARSGVTIAAPDASFTPAAGTYANQTTTYVLSSSTTLDVYMQIVTQTLSVSESTNSTQTPNLSCSYSGSTSIAYSLSSYNGATIPSFVSIDSATGVLTISAPSVSSSTNNSFYIDSTISGLSGPVQSIVNLAVKKCTASNCKICTVSDSSVCATCNVGFRLSLDGKNLCERWMSEIAQSLSTASQAAVGAIIFISAVSSFTNFSLMSNIWSIINQLQLLFFLFLTGAIIPEDVKGNIRGFSICLNPFSSLQSKSNGIYDYVSRYFNFGLENSILEDFEIKSDSTIVNLTSFFFSIVILCILHFLIFLTQKLLPKESKCNCCNIILSVLHWILQKLMILFTFALYIRIILETNQLILISCVSEIYQFNFYGTRRIISITFAFLSFIGCGALIMIMILFTFSKDAYRLSESPDKRSKFANLFDGVSLNKKSRLFACLLLIRRAIFVILLITIGPKSPIIVISILVGLQLIYLVILATIRPYEMIISNMIEITNEFYFLVILATLLKYNTDEGWEGTPTAAYTWLISSNSFVGCLIMLVDWVCKRVAKCVNKCCKKNRGSVQDNTVHIIVPDRIDNLSHNVEHSNVRVNNENQTGNFIFGSRKTSERTDNKIHDKR